MSDADREAYADMHARLSEAAACAHDGTAALAELAEYARRRAKGREAWPSVLPPVTTRGPVRRFVGRWVHRLRVRQPRT